MLHCSVYVSSKTKISGSHEAKARKLTADLINRAIDIAEDFEESVRVINDLAREDNWGFRAWTWDVNLFNRRQQEHQREYKVNLARALWEYRTLEKLSAIDDVMIDHDQSNYSLTLVRKYKETQLDALYSLSKLVTPLRDSAGATIARRFSDYMSSTVSTDYDAVVACYITSDSAFSMHK